MSVTRSRGIRSPPSSIIRPLSPEASSRASGRRGRRRAHTPGTVLVRDSKRPEDARLTLTPRAWTGFVDFAAA
ncbi:DUF397 domain-containing protein [Streptomyces sp. NPDC048331]|uniref:DUF397 domain-containing protein n=1 Tax=Streptomyces sp. NPDC048331 TaxID=3365534 RepID=UPI00371CEC9A